MLPPYCPLSGRIGTDGRSDGGTASPDDAPRRPGSARTAPRGVRQRERCAARERPAVPGEAWCGRGDPAAADTVKARGGRIDRGVDASVQLAFTHHGRGANDVNVVFFQGKGGLAAYERRFDAELRQMGLKPGR